MIEDAELLRQYSQEGSEAAFAGLVQRHINFVYACALRRVGGDSHLAEDVTQKVFTALASNAGALARQNILSGWLYTTARNTSAQLVRSERRRHVRESAAQLMNDLTSTTPCDAEWKRLRPVLDDAMDGLSRDDRQAVLLRFFEGKSYADIGAGLRLAENTARMRVERALEKLRDALGRRGVTSTTTGLAVALGNQAGVAAPAGLAASVTGAALASTVVSAGGWLTTMIGIGKVQAGIVGAVALAGAAPYVWQAESNAGLQHEIASMVEERQAMSVLRGENRRLATAAAEVEALRRDDVELKQLAVRAAEVKKGNDERARLARPNVQASAQDRWKELQAWIREQDRLAQVEVERMNREGSALVEKFKSLSAEAKDGTVHADARAKAEVAAKVMFAEIQAKQQEIKAFIEETRRVLSVHQAELRQLAANGAGPTDPPGSSAAKEQLELQQRAAEIERRRAGRAENSATPPVSTNGTLILRP